MDGPLLPRLQGYKQRNTYIATQGPLQNTVDDFWRMMWEHRCSCIVMLCELEEALCRWTGIAKGTSTKRKVDAGGGE